MNLFRENDHLLTPVNFPGPVIILQGSDTKSAVRKMLRYTKKVHWKNARITIRHEGADCALSLDEMNHQSIYDDLMADDEVPLTAKS